MFHKKWLTKLSALDSKQVYQVQVNTCILGSYDIKGSMISRYLNFLWLLVKATHDDANICKTCTLDSFSSANKFNLVNNECICGKKTVL